MIEMNNHQVKIKRKVSKCFDLKYTPGIINNSSPGVIDRSTARQKSFHLKLIFFSFLSKLSSWYNKTHLVTKQVTSKIHHADKDSSLAIKRLKSSSRLGRSSCCIGDRCTQINASICPRSSGIISDPPRLI